MEKIFFKIPQISRVYHIFDTDTKRSLCGNFAMFGYKHEESDVVTGKESYQKGQDCKTCFRKANLTIDTGKEAKDE